MDYECQPLSVISLFPTGSCLRQRRTIIPNFDIQSRLIPICELVAQISLVLMTSPPKRGTSKGYSNSLVSFLEVTIDHLKSCTKLRQEMRSHSASIVHLPFGISLYAASSGQVDASTFERSFHRTASNRQLGWNVNTTEGLVSNHFFDMFRSLSAVHPWYQRMSSTRWILSVYSRHLAQLCFCSLFGRIKTDGFEHRIPWPCGRWLEALGCFSEAFGCFRVLSHLGCFGGATSFFDAVGQTTSFIKWWGDLNLLYRAGLAQGPSCKEPW